MVGCDNTGKALGHSGVSPIGGFKNRSDKIPLRNAVARVAPASGRGKDDMTSQGPIQVCIFKPHVANGFGMGRANYGLVEVHVCESVAVQCAGTVAAAHAYFSFHPSQSAFREEREKRERRGRGGEGRGKREEGRGESREGRGEERGEEGTKASQQQTAWMFIWDVPERSFREATFPSTSKLFLFEMSISMSPQVLMEIQAVLCHRGIILYEKDWEKTICTYKCPFGQQKGREPGPCTHGIVTGWSGHISSIWGGNSGAGCGKELW